MTTIIDTEPTDTSAADDPGTGNELVDNLIVETILQAQSMNNSPLPAAVDAVKALHAAVMAWNALVYAEAAQ